MARKNEKESSSSAALHVLSDNEVSEVVGGSRKGSSGVMFLQFTFKLVGVKTIS